MSGYRETNVGGNIDCTAGAAVMSTCVALCAKSDALPQSVYCAGTLPVPAATAVARGAATTGAYDCACTPPGSRSAPQPPTVNPLCTNASAWLDLQTCGAGQAMLDWGCTVGSLYFHCEKTDSAYPSDATCMRIYNDRKAQYKQAGCANDTILSFTCFSNRTDDSAFAESSCPAASLTSSSSSASATGTLTSSRSSSAGRCASPARVASWRLVAVAVGLVTVGTVSAWL
ncbi:hypothetical protein DFJ73DRAFT_798253 [Zopfochytrium polystomum]|nr:hypothetical protein DFJ73DRAFT_798253 [Zopfochytrium polystomum]